MSPFVEESGTAMPLSEITVGTLQDMGCVVNYGGADAFAKALFSGTCVCNRRRVLGDDRDDEDDKEEEEVDDLEPGNKKKKHRRMNEAYMSALEDAKKILQDMQAEPVPEGLDETREFVMGSAVGYVYYDAEDKSFGFLIVTKDDLTE